MLHFSVWRLIQMGTFVPQEIKPYVLSKYGMFTMNDFDKFFKLNDLLGKPYDNCFASIMSLENPRKYHSMLSSEEKLLFNIVYSAIKSPQGVKNWL